MANKGGGGVKKGETENRGKEKIRGKSGEIGESEKVKE